MLRLILLAFAFVFFALATAGVASGRWNLIAAGLLFLTAAEIFTGVVTLTH